MPRRRQAGRAGFATRKTRGVRREIYVPTFRIHYDMPMGKWAKHLDEAWYVGETSGQPDKYINSIWARGGVADRTQFGRSTLRVYVFVFECICTKPACTFQHHYDFSFWKSRWFSEIYSNITKKIIRNIIILAIIFSNYNTLCDKRNASPT